MSVSSAEVGYFESMADGFDLYTRMPAGPGRTALRHSMTNAETMVATDIAGENTVHDEEGIFEIASSTTRLAIDSLSSYEPTANAPDPEFVMLFEEGMEAFFPDDIDMATKTTLFDLAMKGTEEPNGNRIANEAIYEARAQFIEALFGKRLKDYEYYQGISIKDLLRTASWLYGDSDEEATERGWSLDPKATLIQNLALLRRTTTQLQHTSAELASLADIPQPAVLQFAGRGLYRYGYQSAQMKADLRQMRKDGTLRLLRQRPDILNYPLEQQRKIEDEYVALGIDVEEVRRHAKLYVSKPSTIRERLDACMSCIQAIDDGIPEAEIDYLRSELCASPSVLTTNSKTRIDDHAQLVAQYARLSDWREVVNNPSPNNVESPRRAALSTLLRAKLPELSAAMAEEPQANIFFVAKRVMNEDRGPRPSRSKAARRQKS